MDKEKQIEEMAKDLKGEDYAVVIVQGKTTSLSNQTKKYLRRLIDKGYRKITENEVVISKKEYENLKNQLKEMEKQRDEQAYITEDLIQEKHLWTDQARKKMAREILEYIEQNFSEEWGTVDCLYDVYEWISNTFDIDLGDEK